MSDLSFAPASTPAFQHAVVPDLIERTVDPGSPAYAVGHAAGFAAGRREAERTLDQARVELERESAARAASDAARLEGLSRALEAAIADVTRSAQPSIAALDTRLLAAAVEIAEAILGTELRNDDASARAIAARVLANPSEGAVLRVRVHPADRDALAALGLLRDLPVVADATLARGDAVVDRTDGVLDARISASVERVRAALGEVRS